MNVKIREPGDIKMMSAKTIKLEVIMTKEKRKAGARIRQAVQAANVKVN